jgi:hypothetical protein
MIINPYRYGGAPPATSHRYWRIYITANDGNATFFGATEFEMRGSVGGANLLSILTGAGPATASGETNASNAAWRASDNSNTSGWLANVAGGGLPGWWKYDFGHAGHTGPSTADVKQILIRGSFNAPTGSPKDFQLQWSDNNSTWTTVLTVTGQTGWTGASDARTFNVP